MYQQLKKDLIQTLTHEISQELHNTLYDSLHANLHRESRNHLDNYPNVDIRKLALSYAQYCSILQTFDSVFGYQDYYQLCHTVPKGGYFPQIELSNLILLPRRSVKKEAWQKANYLKELAKNNRSLNSQLDFLEFLPSNQKVLVIMDISYENHIITIRYLVPDSHLNTILVEVDYIELAEQFEQPIESDGSISPVIKLKKTLEEAEKIAVNQR